MFAEDDALHIRRVHDRIDDGELRIGEFARHFRQRGGMAESDGDNRRIAVTRKAPQRLLALRVGLDFKFARRDPGLGPITLCAAKGAFVEALVEFSAEIIDDGGPEFRSARREGAKRGEQANPFQPHRKPSRKDRQASHAEACWQRVREAAWEGARGQR